MPDQVTLQFSADGTLYHVPAYAIKHVWLSVETFDSPGEVGKAVKGPLVTPYSGLCRYTRDKRTYYRFFLNQSYHPVLAGRVDADAGADGALVMDFLEAKAVGTETSPRRGKGRSK